MAILTSTVINGNLKVNGSQVTIPSSVLLSGVTSNGFMKYSSSTGAITIDTTTYLSQHLTNTFSIYGGDTVVATFNQSADASVTFVAGDNVSLTPDATNKKITISASDGGYTSTWSVYATNGGNATCVSTFDQSHSRSITFKGAGNTSLSYTNGGGTITISSPSHYQHNLRVHYEYGSISTYFIVPITNKAGSTYTDGYSLHSIIGYLTGSDANRDSAIPTYGTAVTNFSGTITYFNVVGIYFNSIAGSTVNIICNPIYYYYNGSLTLNHALQCNDLEIYCPYIDNFQDFMTSMEWDY